MTNIEKLKQIGILSEIRQRQGADDGNDERFDTKINRMDNDQLISALCGWELGDPSWWNHFKRKFDQLEKLK